MHRDLSVEDIDIAWFDRTAFNPHQPVPGLRPYQFRAQQGFKTARSTNDGTSTRGPIGRRDAAALARRRRLAACDYRLATAMPCSRFTRASRSATWRIASVRAAG